MTRVPPTARARRALSALALAAGLLPALLSAGCAGVGSEPPEPEAIGLLGQELYAPELSDEARAPLERALAEARAEWAAHPDESSAIWVGRRLAYLGRYREAQAWYTARLVDFPDSYRLRRHRGHRWITLREFDRAVADLEQAWDLARAHPDRVEPDGAPNAHGVPVSTDHTNILYHWALAEYLRGEFVIAAGVAHLCEQRAPNADMRVAAAYWRYHALGRSGDREHARRVARAVPSHLVVLENEDYRDLLYAYSGRGHLADLRAAAAGVAGATVGYGLAMWKLEASSRGTEAIAELAALVERGPWNAFGVIAAEADLARMRVTPAAKGRE